ncbi:Dyp-type peroxidase [Oceanobacter mangrovi]|uniref:Dyp-type peroxidase n=1 Tax=Oceanobacter mangrovi TaxID=2862510 RepID=UPI001C8D77BC|nr:Dyp-type peroxidase [Oceanobacter mangrovi]
MNSPQAGIFREGYSAFYYLEYQLSDTATVALIKQALQQANRVAIDGVSVVVAFGKQAWDRLNPDWAPADLVPFTTLEGVNGHTSPATQRDVFFWIHSSSPDDNFDAVMQIQNAMQTVAELQLDLPGFRYHDARDLTGFVDGTANPKEDARQLAALIPQGQPGAGGSYVLSQKWVHDLAGFGKMPVPEQEKVIGRTKADDIELEGDAMPNNSHVSRTDVKIDGVGMKIWRRSGPYGSASEQGLYFLCFACELKRISVQLERMFGLTEDGLHDRLIEFSKAVTGSYWFAPSNEDLAALLQLPE